MALANIWTLTAGATTKACSAWGITGMKRTGEFGTKTGEVALKMDGANVDSALVFAYNQTITILRAGVPWFVGLVTKTPRMASPEAESITYTISDPWWYLEHTPFQQQWASQTPGGSAVALLTTTQSRVTIGQSITGVSMNLGQVMLEVLYYALYAAQGQPWPTTANITTLTAPAPNPANGALPFQIGAITPSITVPFFQVTDKFCSEIIEQLLRYVPDTGKWFDFTTTPPTLHIDNRANLAPRTLSVFGGTVTSKFNPTPRYDLQVPVVIAKYQETTTINGISYSQLIVDKYPPNVLDNTPCALVQTVDLLPGSETFQKQPVTVIDRPRTEADSVAMPWLQAQPDLYWLFGTATYPSVYDTANITVNRIDSTLAPGDPNNTAPPPGFSLNVLTEQLISGAIAPWMTSALNIFSAKVVLEVQLGYTGTDPATLAIFNVAPAVNTRLFHFTITATNASSQTYSQLTAFQQGEPAPVGNAQILYNILAKLHQQGELELTEPECSGLLPLGCIFNTTDGLAEWQNMDALILSVTETIETGITTVEFGPTLYLGLQDLVELARANRGRLPAANSTQRTTGQSGSDNSVVGNQNSPDNSSATPPGGGGAGSSNPYAGTDSSTGATPRITVLPGMHQGFPATGLGPFSVPVGTGYVNVSVAFSYTYGNITVSSNTLEVASANSDGSAQVLAATVATPNSSNGTSTNSGTGTLSQYLFKYTAVITNGKASVSFDPLVGGSQGFGVCNSTVTGPWGV